MFFKLNLFDDYVAYNKTNNLMDSLHTAPLSEVLHTARYSTDEERQEEAKEELKRRGCSHKI